MESEPPRTAALMDGQRLAPETVEVEAAADGLLLRRASGEREPLAFADLLLVSDLPDRTVVRHRRREDWRLVIRPALAGAPLARLRRTRGRPGRTALVYAALALLFALGAALLWVKGNDLLAAAAPLVPESVTVPLGEAVVRQASFGRICASDEAGEALERLVARLLPDGGTAEPVVVRIADLGLANALAAPGSQVLLTRGLIAEASGPDEVAGVLAHELGHVEHRHATRMLLRDLGMSALLGGSDIGRVSDSLFQRRMSREMEREADAFALAALARAGISPRGLVAFFERNAPRSEGERDLFGKIGTYVATHPPDAERLAAFRAAAARAGALPPALDEAGWRALRDACGPGASD